MHFHANPVSRNDVHEALKSSLRVTLPRFCSEVSFVFLNHIYRLQLSHRDVAEEGRQVHKVQDSHPGSGNKQHFGLMFINMSCLQLVSCLYLNCQ